MMLIRGCIILRCCCGIPIDSNFTAYSSGLRTLLLVTNTTSFPTTFRALNPSPAPLIIPSKFQTTPKITKYTLEKNERKRIRRGDPKLYYVRVAGEPKYYIAEFCISFLKNGYQENFRTPFGKVSETVSNTIQHQQ